MKFSQVIGQTVLKEQLAEMARSGRISHAMLFSSQSSGTGALPLALAYATYVMCQDPDKQGDSCGRCASCFQMQAMQHPDCHYVYPVNNSKLATSVGRGDGKPISDMFVELFRGLCGKTDGYFTEQELYKTIGIENAQGNISKSEATEILRKMSFKSFAGGYKVVIVWLPERMNDAAANSLLKLIEEPAKGTLFLFVSEQLDRVLSTIVSRCQGVVVPSVEDHDIEEALKKRGIDQASAAQIAHRSQGDWIEALRMAALSSDDGQGQDTERFMALMRLCYANKYIELFSWAETMVPLGREAQKQFCETSLEILRSCYMQGIGMERISYVNPKDAEFCRRFAPFVNHASVEGLIEEFETLLRQIRQNGNPKILFPHFALMISKLIRK